MTRKGKIGQYDSALLFLNDAIHADPQGAPHYKNIGQVYFQQAEYEKSTADFTVTLQLKPGDADIWNAIGVNNLRQGKYGAAKESFDKAITINPGQAVYYGNRALAYYDLKDKQKAQEDLERASRLGIAPDPQFIKAIEEMK